MSLEQRLEIAKKACLVAGEIQRHAYQQEFTIETKSSDMDLVTTVDIQSDAAIVEVMTSGLSKAGFDDKILTEETYEEGNTFDFSNTWVIDPLDGTTNFAHGFPHFAVSIAYMVEGQPQVAAIYDTMKDEMFTAIKGHGAHVNGKPIHTSSVTDLEQALLCTGFPYDRDKKPRDNMDLFEKFMMTCHGVRRVGSAALDLAYVAAGRLDGFWEMRLSPWDVTAGGLLVTEAGGFVADFSGQPLDYTVRRVYITGAGTQPLLDAIVKNCQAVPVALS